MATQIKTLKSLLIFFILLCKVSKVVSLAQAIKKHAFFLKKTCSGLNVLFLRKLGSPQLASAFLHKEKLERGALVLVFLAISQAQGSNLWTPAEDISWESKGS